MKALLIGCEAIVAVLAVWVVFAVFCRVWLGRSPAAVYLAIGDRLASGPRLKPRR